MKKISILFYSLLLIISASAQQEMKVYPTHWWAGMKNHNLQLMIHGKNIAAASLSISYPGVQLKKINRVENKNYVFLDLVLLPTVKPGSFKIKMEKEGVTSSINYELKSRRKGNGTAFAQGISSQDLVYLIMPDRFSNGDYSNDKVPGMREQTLNRDSMYHRHGGDIQGVINHLDYLKDLGVTSVWLTPILENDMAVRTEHGYAITDHYKVDPRHGGNDAYQKLSDELHKRGMKLVQDAVYNHTGLFHFFIEDLPMKDWIHQWPKYTNPNYKDQTLFDPHGSFIDKQLQLNGWFDRIMPDLNQENPFLATYLIQNAIWSVEEFGVDSWRIDTYIYNDLEFMNRCNKALVDEYPNITMFGEVWVSGTANEAYFVKNNINTPFKSNLIGITDFQSLFDGIYPALRDGNFDRLYQTLSNDFLYKDPLNNVVFLDNHDIARFYSVVNEDVAKLKMGIAWLLTERGTPQFYYGTEIAMAGLKDDTHPDGLVRSDFKGGWKEDKENKFTKDGRTAKENDVFNWTKTIANYRKNSTALQTGKLMQFVPQNGTYTYFRYDEKSTVMVVMNAASEEKAIDAGRFAEIIKGYNKGRNIVTNEIIALSEKMNIPAKTVWVLELSQ